MCARAQGLFLTFHPLTVTTQLFQPRDDDVGEGHGANYFSSLFWSFETDESWCAIQCCVYRRIFHYTDNLIIVLLTAIVTLLPIMIAEGRRRQFLSLALSTAHTRETRHCERPQALQIEIHGILFF